MDQPRAHRKQDEPRRWTEAMISKVEPAEHDFQEFKSSLFIADGAHIAPGFTGLLSKQISAFSNGAGGRIFLGLDDDGQIDGGVLTMLKGGGTRAWLEDIIPTLVEPPLKNFNVYEVPRKGKRSLIKPGCAVYIVEIGPSENAPHQALDYRYYLRIAGKSRPMGNVHLQDVLQRRRHPQVEMARVSPYGGPEYIEADPRGPKVAICFQAFLENQGRTLAHHVGASVLLPRPLVDAYTRQKTLQEPGVEVTQEPGELAFFRYHPRPVFPGQGLLFLRFWLVIHARNRRAYRTEEAKIGWRIYADDAPPKRSEAPLQRFAVIKEGLRWLDERLRAGRGAGKLR
ncbi:ATP-binding protein [Myxococcota bacterium]|nr:ATP-binding protein [Myxococcota bacterium]MBU1429708.1 ATP-binding protein [Myxococcota bacterium]MBU1899804.1 ATP-binding protein [Myxococcota bacterium]